MPSLLEVAEKHASFRRRLALAAAGEAAKMWARVDPGRIQDSWVAQLGRLLVLVTGAQQVVAGRADSYLDQVLDMQRLSPDAEGQLVAEALAGVASDGRGLDGVLYQPVVTALAGIQAGASPARALAGGAATLDMIVRTQVADAGRVADQVAMVSRPGASGYVRMLVGRSCSRCVVLAGRWYAVNRGFDRHPRCDCVHVPGREDTADDVRTDPKAYFRSLSDRQQAQIFTAPGAEAIRRGADIGQVVNARRGARGLTPAGARITAAEARLLRGGLDKGRLQSVDVFGQQLFITSEGSTTRGLAGVRLGAKVDGLKKTGGRYRSAKAPRLMPESILQIAGTDRDLALRLLKRNGYIL